ncbi:MAG TPA: asparagine synthase C-terminal domain-containing protein [Candidatus Nitrosotenuis sp.]|nr:asparagine synthase C-terminal domain-containing protein [Candidatus Nitrosotenuis sp.]
MSTIFDQTYQIIKDSVLRCSADCLSLSGGLDSTILAYFLKGRKTNAVSIIAKDFIANDLTYCQLAASRFDLPLNIKFCETNEIYSGIEETIKILKNFNDIEIRNNVVMYLAASAAKELGFNKIMTGDGADEIFAGYSFLLNKSAEDLERDLKRIRKIMHFPSHAIGKSLGVDVESPFCSNEVLEFAETVPVDLKVHEEGGKKFGKWILRKTFEDKIPKAIAWRQKSPMQDGAGTQGLTEFFEGAIPDSVFADKVRKIREKDGVTIRTKESLQYYEIYRRYNAVPETAKSGTKCPDCTYVIEEDSKFCRMCGRFPL